MLCKIQFVIHTFSLHNTDTVTTLGIMRRTTVELMTISQSYLNRLEIVTAIKLCMEQLNSVAHSQLLYNVAAGKRQAQERSGGPHPGTRTPQEGYMYQVL